MKDFLTRIRGEYLWFILFLVADVFFVFLIWLAAPDVAASFTFIIVLFTIITIAAGCLVRNHQKNKMIQALESFLIEPSEANTNAVLRRAPNYLHSFIVELSAKLRDQAMQISTTQEDLLRYQEFIESWTHEVKAPLALATLVLANHREEMSPYVYTRMEHVKTSISKDVDRVLYYARLQADHVDYSFTEVRLDECVRAVFADFHLTAQEQETEILLDFEPTSVISDEKVLAFMLSQILSNAFKYTARENGFVECAIHTDEAEQKIYLCIRDNGPGVSPEDTPFVFEKGFTGNQPTRQNATGMGLYFASKYAEALSITLELEPRSTSGKGFGICLVFPA